MESTRSRLDMLHSDRLPAYESIARGVGPGGDNGEGGEGGKYRARGEGDDGDCGSCSCYVS